MVTLWSFLLFTLDWESFSISKKWNHFFGFLLALTNTALLLFGVKNLLVPPISAWTEKMACPLVFYFQNTLLALICCIFIGRCWWPNKSWYWEGSKSTCLGHLTFSHIYKQHEEKVSLRQTIICQYMASSVYPMQEKWIKLELSDWWEILISHCLVFIPTHQEAETSVSYRMELLAVCLEKIKIFLLTSWKVRKQ